MVGGGGWRGGGGHDIKGCSEGKRGEFMNVPHRERITSEMRGEGREVQRGGYQMETTGCEMRRRHVFIARYGGCEMRVGDVSAVVFNGCRSSHTHCGQHHRKQRNTNDVTLYC